MLLVHEIAETPNSHGFFKASVYSDLADTLAGRTELSTQQAVVVLENELRQRKITNVAYDEEEDYLSMVEAGPGRDLRSCRHFAFQMG